MDYFQERGRTLVEPSLERLLACCRAHHMRVIYTTVASEPDVVKNLARGMAHLVEAAARTRLYE